MSNRFITKLRSLLPICGTIFFAFAASAQLGSGWNVYTPSERLEYETNDVLYTISPPPSSFNNGFCAYSKSGTNRTFQLLTHSSNRIEIRPNDDYSTGTHQFQADIVMSPPTSGECLHQLFNGSAGPWCIIRQYTNYNGSLRIFAGPSTSYVATNLNSRSFRLNTINNMTNDMCYFYVNGRLVYSITNRGGTYYTKYGTYGTHDNAHPAYVVFNNATLFTGGRTNGAGAGDFSLSASPGVSVTQGHSVSNTITETDLNGYAGTVDLSVSGLPAGVTASFSPNPTTGTSTLTLTAGGTATTGTATVTITGTDSTVVGQTLTHSTNVNLTVNPAGDFSVGASPGSSTIVQGNSGTNTITVTAASGSNDTVHLSVSGLPANTTFNFNPVSLTGTGTSMLSIFTTTNTPTGIYSLSVTATSSTFTNSAVLSLTISSSTVALPGTLFWTAGSGSGINWSTALNWTNVTAGGYGPPGISNDLIFTNIAFAAASNSVDNIANISTAVASLAFANTNGFHTTQIASGAALTIAGAKGLVVGSESDLSNTAAIYASVVGTNASLVVSNSSANLTIRQGLASGSGNVQRATLDLSGLDNFNAIVNQVAVGTAGPLIRETGTLILAKTNSITASGSPGILAGDNSSNGGGVDYIFLGQSNSIFANTITVGRQKTVASVLFNPAFADAVAYFRGANGASRVSTWLVGDNSAQSSSSSATHGTNDFSGGTIDALVDTFIVGKSQKTTGADTFGVLTFAAGTLDVNTLQIGFQAQSGATSAGNGTVNVNGGLLNVNTNLELAHTSGGAGTTNTIGTLNINGGIIQTTNLFGGGGISTVNLNSGTIDSQGGRIANISTLNIGDGVSGAALLENAASISISNAIAIAANGTLAGNSTVTTPNLIVTGTISPGANGIGQITATANVTLTSGGAFAVAVTDAGGNGGTGFDFLQVNGQLNIAATAANPFTIQLQSAVGGQLNTVTNFNADTNYDWNIATANGGIASFDPAKFTVDTTQFQNDLQGGYFYVRTNGNSLILSFTNNQPPAAGIYFAYQRGGGVTIPIANLSGRWSDPDGDPVVLNDVNGASTNGIAVASDGQFIYYAGGNGADTILYTVADVRTNPPAIYRTDDTQRTVTGEIILLPPPAIDHLARQSTNLILSGSGGATGGTYYTLSTTNLLLPWTNWTVMATNSFDADGNFIFTNAAATNAPQQFYILRVQ